MITTKTGRPSRAALTPAQLAERLGVAEDGTEVVRPFRGLRRPKEAADVSPSLQLVVLHYDHTHMYYPLSMADGGWRIDHPSRCIVIGRGVPRTYVPLDGVRSFAIERITDV